MRKVSFSVPLEVFGDFTDKLTETGLENQVFGRDEDGDIIIGVFYEREESDEVNMLEDYLEELVDSIEEEDDED